MTINHAAAHRTDTGTLPIGTMIGWAMGSAGATILFSPYSQLFLRFMTDYLAIPAGLAGLMVGGAKILDAASDIMVGTLSDRTRSRWGRRRPFLLAGAVMTSLCFIPLFATPPGLAGAGAAAFLFVFVLLFSIGFALWYVPFVAMTSEMTNSYIGRSTLVSYRITGSASGALIGSAGAAYLLVLFGGGRAGHAYMAMTIGAVGLICMLACLYLSRDAPATERHVGTPYTIAQQARLLVRNKPFFLLILMKILFYIGMGLNSVSIAYFVQQGYGLSGAWLGTCFFVLMGSMLATVPLWLRISKRLEKREIAIIALSLNGIGGLSCLLVHPGDPPILALLRFAIAGISNGGITLMAFSMLADTMEYDYLRTGLRREGLFAGFVTLVEKSATAIGITIVGLILGSMGYISSRGGADVVQPASAITGVYLTFAVIPAILTIAGAIVLSGYGLTNARLQSLRDAGPPTLPNTI